MQLAPRYPGTSLHCHSLAGEVTGLTQATPSTRGQDGEEGEWWTQCTCWVQGVVAWAPADTDWCVPGPPVAGLPRDR